jgi:sugar phosphate permease
MLVFGLGEGMTLGSSEVYAMDLAPERGRGTFLGIWSTLRNVGGLIAPLVIGAAAQLMDMPAAFALVGGLLVFSGILMAVFGQETRRAPEGISRR